MEKIVVIKSYFSEDDYSTDGNYQVVIPQEFSKNYKKVISEVANVRSDLGACMIESVDDIEITSSSAFKKEDYEKIWDKLEELRDEGGSIENTLDVLGWKWKKVKIEMFDADYNEFKSSQQF